MTRTAVLGMGAMGSAMSRRLADCGHEVVAWDRDEERRSAWDDDRVSVAGDPATAVKEVDVAITMVRDGRAAREVAERFLPGLPEQAVWLQCSTVGADADDLAELAAGHGRQMLDAPVSGSTGPARSGALTMLVSGPLELVERSRPVLEALGERTVVVGEQQQASRLKLVINSWMAAATVALADALTGCDRSGVDRATFLEVLDGGPLGMPYALAKAKLMGERRYDPGFPVELALKDLRLTEEAEGRKSFLLQAVEDRLERAISEGFGGNDVAAVAEVTS